jgi:hypothetical protein
MFFDSYYPAEYTILEEFTVIDEIERATADIAEVNAGEHDDETGAALLSRADEVFLAELATLSEAKAMLQFVLLSESEDIDVVAPLESVLRILGNAPAANQRTAKTARNLRWLKAAIHDHGRTQRHFADATFVARVNDRIDSTLALPITTIEEAELMLRLFLATEGGGLDEPVLTALQNVANVLDSAIKGIIGH